MTEEYGKYTEQLVTRRPETTDLAKKIGIISFTLVVTFVLILLSLYFNLLALSPVVLFIAGYLLYMLLARFDIEYEYTVTGNELDVDKIIAKKTRSRLLTVKISQFTEFAPVTDSTKLNDIDSLVEACGIGSEDWCAAFVHESYGNTKLLFSPNSSVLRLIAEHLPRELRGVIPKEL